jgi:hypothetical protein
MESGGWVAWGAFAFGGLALTMWGGGAMKKKKKPYVMQVSALT